jgi:hypothetical protein
MLLYSALFALSYFGAAFCLGFLIQQVPSRNHNSPSIGHLLVLAAAMFTGWVFVRRHQRLFTPSENLRIVLFCSVWVLVLEALVVLAHAQLFSQLPGPWLLGVLAFTVVVDVVIVWGTFRYLVRRMMAKRVPASPTTAV